MYLAKASLIICLILLSAFLPSISQSGTVSTVVAVIPGKVVVDVNDIFAVDIWIYNVTDMSAWQIPLLWNRSMLYCTKARVNTPIEWGGMPFDVFNKTAADVNRNVAVTTLQFGCGIDNEFNATHGEYDKCECAVRYYGGDWNSVNRSLAVITLWFQALQTGSTFVYLEYPYVKMLTSECKYIANVGYNCVIEVREPINILTQHTAWLKK